MVAVASAFDPQAGLATGAAGSGRPLLIAIAGSLALHASVFAWIAGGGGDGATNLPRPAAFEALQVALRNTSTTALTSLAPSPVVLPAPVHDATPPATEPLPPVSRAGTGARAGRTGPLRADALPVTDRSRLGVYLEREMSEFPAEIDAPPRLAQPVTVALPAHAAPIGASEVVTIWAVVKPDGTAEEISVATGSGAFAEATVLALREARFVPARKGAVAIAYPLSLEFRFAPPEPAPPATRSDQVAGRR